MNSLDRLKTAFVPGAMLEVIEQTFVPALIGTRRRIETGGNKTSYRFAEIGEDNKTHRTGFPKRAGDVTWIDDSTVRIALRMGFKEPSDHHVTLRFLVPPRLPAAADSHSAPSMRPTPF
jgi:hypothetical protein